MEAPADAELQIRLWVEDALGSGEAPPRFDRVLVALVEAATCTGWIERSDGAQVIRSGLAAAGLRGIVDKRLALATGPQLGLWASRGRDRYAPARGVSGATVSIPLMGGDRLAATLTMAVADPTGVTAQWVEQSGRAEPSRMPEVDAAAIVVRGAGGPCHVTSRGWRGDRATGGIFIPGASLDDVAWIDAGAEVRLDRAPARVTLAGQREMVPDEAITIAVMLLISPEGSVEAAAPALWEDDLGALATALTAMVRQDATERVMELADERFPFLAMEDTGEAALGHLPLDASIETVPGVVIDSVEIGEKATVARIAVDPSSELPVGVQVLGGRDEGGGRYINVERGVASARYGYPVSDLRAHLVPRLHPGARWLDLDVVSRGTVTTARIPVSEAMWL